MPNDVLTFIKSNTPASRTGKPGKAVKKAGVGKERQLPQKKSFQDFLDELAHNRNLSRDVLESMINMEKWETFTTTDFKQFHVHMCGELANSFPDLAESPPDLDEVQDHYDRECSDLMNRLEFRQSMVWLRKMMSITNAAFHNFDLPLFGGAERYATAMIDYLHNDRKEEFQFKKVAQRSTASKDLEKLNATKDVAFLKGLISMAEEQGNHFPCCAVFPVEWKNMHDAQYTVNKVPVEDKNEGLKVLLLMLIITYRNDDKSMRLLFQALLAGETIDFKPTIYYLGQLMLASQCVPVISDLSEVQTMAKNPQEFKNTILKVSKGGPASHACFSLVVTLTFAKQVMINAKRFGTVADKFRLASEEPYWVLYEAAHNTMVSAYANDFVMMFRLPALSLNMIQSNLPQGRVISWKARPVDAADLRKLETAIATFRDTTATLRGAIYSILEHLQLSTAEIDVDNEAIDDMSTADHETACIMPATLTPTTSALQQDHPTGSELDLPETGGTAHVDDNENASEAGNNEDDVSFDDDDASAHGEGQTGGPEDHEDVAETSVADDHEPTDQKESEHEDDDSAFEDPPLKTTVKTQPLKRQKPRRRTTRTSGTHDDGEDDVDDGSNDDEVQSCNDEQEPKSRKTKSNARAKGGKGRAPQWAKDLHDTEGEYDPTKGRKRAGPKQDGTATKKARK